jgi:LysM repeat protein
MSEEQVIVEREEPVIVAVERRNPYEWINFGLLVIASLLLVVGVALARPFIFGRVIPAILGEGQTPTPAPADSEPAVQQAPVIINDPSPTTEAEPTEPAPTTEAAPPGGEVEAQQPGDFPTSVPPRSHVVQRGENLTAIARAYNVSVQDIVALNNINNPNHIEAGKTLLIPGP